MLRSVLSMRPINAKQDQPCVRLDKVYFKYVREAPVLGS